MAEPVDHVLEPDQRGGIHRVQLTAGVEHRFTIRERDFVPVGPVQVLSLDGGANLFVTVGDGDEPAVLDGVQTTVLPAAMGAITRSTGRLTPTVVRVIADGSCLISVQRAKDES